MTMESMTFEERQDERWKQFFDMVERGPKNSTFITDMLDWADMPVARKHISGDSILSVLIFYMHDELAEAVVDKKICNINAVNREGRTALSLAASRGMTGVVGKLLEMGANTYIRDENGLSAADYTTNGEIRQMIAAASKAELKDGLSAQKPVTQAARPKVMSRKM